jgi:hypothetical protein
MGKGVTYGDSPVREILDYGGCTRQVQLKKTCDGMGIGAFAMEDMDVGEFVGEYVGEVITKRTASAREKAPQGLYYTMEILTTNLVVDATHQVTSYSWFSTHTITFTKSFLSLARNYTPLLNWAFHCVFMSHLVLFLHVFF